MSIPILNKTKNYEISLNKEYWRITQINGFHSIRTINPNNDLIDSYSRKVYQYVIDDYDMRAHRRIWRMMFKDGLIEPNSKTLLINDADQIFYNCIDVSTISTIVDAHAYEFTQSHIKKYLHTIPFINTVDSAGFTRKLTLIDDTFTDAFEDDSFKTKYDLIFVNVKNRDELNIHHIERYFTMLNDFGFLSIQIRASDYHHNYRTALDHYFTTLFEKIRTTHSNQELTYYFTFRKISSLV